MRSLKEIYPGYAGRAEVFAIGFDPLERAGDLDRYRQEQGYPFPVLQTNADLVKTLDVHIRSTKLLVDGNGVIIRREGYGGMTPDDWRKWMDEAATRQP